MNVRALLGGLLPLITTPAGLVILGAGAIGYAVYNILSEKKEEQESGSETVEDGYEPPDGPLYVEYSTAPDTVDLPWDTVEPAVEATVQSTVEAPFTLYTVKEEKTTEQPLAALTDEELKKEMIRQTMSELGKRSAAARAIKKANV